ncbi:MAG: KAP family NTPase [Rhabdochlamydiaceae bacterium]
MQINSDKPLIEPSQDILGYRSFASHLAKSIRYMPEEGAVLGIYGPWGSGKTSLLNLVQYYLKQEPELSPLVVSFNPWRFSGQEDLTIRFFAALKAELQFAHLGDLADKVWDFEELVSAIDFPWYVQGIFRLVSKFRKKFIEKYALIDRKRENLINALQNQKKKILVVIDDIDRLTSEEIRQIFKLVKSVANFPNVVYLLAFDENVVAQALESGHAVSGREYLKKIIQVPFELPQPDKSGLISLLCGRLDQLLAQVPKERFDQKRWHTILLRGIRHYINTPRDVIRLTNSLNVTYQCVRDEVNPVDFVALETLRIFEPEAYHLIRVNYTMLTGSAENASIKPWSEFLKREIPEEPTALNSILTTLFPKLQKGVQYDSGWLELWRRNLQVCSPDCFAVYFRLAVPIGAISNADMQNALAQTKDVRAFATLLLQLNKEKGTDNHTRVHGFLNRLNDFTQKDILSEDIPNVIQAFFSVGDQLLGSEDRKQSFWDTSGNAISIWGIISDLLRRIPQDARIGVIRDSMARSNEVSFIFFILGHLKLEHTERKNPQDQAQEPLILKSEELTPLFQTAAKKAQSAAQASQLLVTPYLPFVLKQWKEHGEDTAEVNAWLDRALTSDDEFLKFLRHFMSPSFHLDPFSNFSSTIYSFNLKLLDPLLAPNQIIDRVRSIKKSDNNDKQEVIDCFIKSYESRLEGKETEHF